MNRAEEIRRRRPPDWDFDRTYWFLHLMKTGGTSLVQYIRDNFPLGEIEPDLRTEITGDSEMPGRGLTYASIERLRALSDERRAEVRVYAGHYPFMVTELIPTDVTMTVLRDPVERSISFLYHCQRYEPHLKDASLEEIYGGLHFPLLIRNYQSKLFALRWTDRFGDRPQLADLVVDEARLAAAKANLATLDLIGFQHRFDEFLDELGRRYGWTFPRRHHARKAPETSAVPSTLRERISEDNRMDIEFFRYAEALHDERLERGA